MANIKIRSPQSQRFPHASG